jgi:Arc/MetJ-type ribon-helix-helix transcriptional regulator
MAASTQPKKDFATRLSQETLARLDDLVRRGRFKTRTAAIEAAVERLFETEKETAEEEYRRKRAAFDRACGALSLGIDRESFREAEIDRLEYELWRNTGRR